MIKASDVFSTKVTCPPVVTTPPGGVVTTGPPASTSNGPTSANTAGAKDGMAPGGTIFLIILLIILGHGGIAVGVCVIASLNLESGLADSIYTVAPDGDR